jgi:precorrin-2 methylase
MLSLPKRREKPKMFVFNHLPKNKGTMFMTSGDTTFYGINSSTYNYIHDRIWLPVIYLNLVKMCLSDFTCLFVSVLLNI